MDRYLAELKKTSDREDRERLEIAMIFFRDRAAINEAMNAVLSGDIPFIEAGGYLLVFGGAASHQTSKMAFDFIKGHYDEILSQASHGWWI